MKIVVLGAAAGGGFPQWNSNAVACRRARTGDPLAERRTQTSIAVSQDGARWFILNASPDLRQQIEATPVLHPRQGLRHSPIAGVLLTGGDVDAIAGLLTLRERHPFRLWATARTHATLKANPIFDVLSAELVARDELTADRPVSLHGNLTATAFALPGKIPLYLEAGQVPAIVTDDTTIALEIREGGRRAVFAPGCAALTDDLRRRLVGADIVFFDATLWNDDEMIATGVGQKTGRRMGHMSLGGPDGTIEAFRGIEVGRKVAIHINNSNPILLADTPERAEIEAAGWIVARDGMEFAL